MDLNRLEARLAARSVFIERSDGAFLGEPHLHGFRLSYAFSPSAVLAQGIAAVAEELRRA